MITGLHWTAWILFFISFGVGLGIVIVFYIRNRKNSDKAAIAHDTGE